MSAAKVIAQGVPLQIVSIPSWKLPVMVHLRAQITDGSGTAVAVADNDATTGVAGTTPGLGIVRSSAGVYDVTFDPCRAIALGAVDIVVIPNVLANSGEVREVAIDKTAANTSAKLGKLRFATNAANGAAAIDPVNGSEIHLCMWLEMS